MLVIIPFLAFCYIIQAIADSINPIGVDPHDNCRLQSHDNCATNCTISTRFKIGDLSETQPLLLKWDGRDATIWYPDHNTGTLTIRAGDPIYLACPGDKMFDVYGVSQHFSSLVCKFPVESDATYIRSSPCLGTHSTIEIGFKLRNFFIRTIELCRDEETFRTYYTKFTMTKMIRNYQRNYPRSSGFLMGSFYPGIRDMNYLYKNQLSTLARILKSITLAKIRMNKQYLTCGHLTAKADFVYGTQQSSTFWYLNTAPQWKTFNAGNWNNLERSIRNFAADRRLDLDVYTGVHGQMTMEDIHGQQQPIHLHVEKGLISVPKFFWKIIYDPLSKRGTAFVGLNDPFIKSVTHDLYLCKDISGLLKWLNWKPRNIRSGISYACYVGDLQAVVPTIPLLDVTNLLI